MFTGVRWRLALVTLATFSHVSHASDLVADIGITSNYVARGITQTNDKPAMQAGLDYVHESGAYIGAWSSEVDSGVEVDVYAGYLKIYDTLGYDIGYMTYNYSDAAFSDDAREFYIGGIYLIFSVYYSSGESAGLNYEYHDFNVEYEFKDLFKIKIHYGTIHADIIGQAYYDSSFKLSRSINGYDFSLTYTAEEFTSDNKLFVTFSKAFKL